MPTENMQQTNSGGPQAVFAKPTLKIENFSMSNNNKYV